jgi:hypothetical protein
MLNGAALVITHAEMTGHKKHEEHNKKPKPGVAQCKKRQLPDLLKSRFSLRIFVLFVAIMFSV